MRTLLAIDRGNDSLKAALFTGAAISERFGARGSDARVVVELVRKLRPDRIAASCVVPSWRAAVEAALESEALPPILWAGHGSRLPYRIAVDEPAEVGTDRLAAAAGAAARGMSSAIIVDAGTAVTVDILAEGIFIGGSIMPGLGLMLGSLRRGTAVLPSLDPGVAVAAAAGGFPGRSTAGAIAAGSLAAFVSGVDSLVRRSLEHVPDGTSLLLTGGGLRILAGRLRPDPVIAPDLVLEGLYRICTGKSPAL